MNEIKHCVLSIFSIGYENCSYGPQDLEPELYTYSYHQFVVKREILGSHHEKEAKEQSASGQWRILQ